MNTGVKSVTISGAVALAIEALGQDEFSVNEIAGYLKASVANYKDIELDVVTSRVSAFLSNAVKPKSRTQNYAKAINPKTKKTKKGVYRLVSPKKSEPIFQPDPTPQVLPFPSKPPKSTVGRKPKEPKSISPKHDSSIDNDFENTALKKLYFGKGGEFAVVSELLFRGYNASIMSVDEGVDITASKKDRFFFIQVKSTGLDDKKMLSVTIKPNRFQSITSASLYYTIVVRYVNKGVVTNRYIIFSQEDLQRYKFNGHIKETDSGLAIKIKEESGQLWLYNGDKQHGIEYHLDRFELIK